MTPTNKPESRISLAARGAMRAVAVAALVLSAGMAQAQQDKSVAVEAVPVVPAFNQWITTYVIVVPEPPVTSVQPVNVAPWDAIPAGTDYQPLPVIMGVPELPLVGAGARQVAAGWDQTLNYQGVYLRQVVVDSRGRKREIRSMATKPKAGERFKIRVTATFDAVADVDLVTGAPWSLRRVSQFYPKPGMSVQIKAGEAVDLPLGANEYFVMSKPADERMVVSVRHAKALGEARSNQPAYRQDGKGGSSYLQLVPNGSFPVVEQLITQAR